MLSFDKVDLLTYVDLLACVDLKNNWLVEFSDLKYKILFKFQVNRVKIDNFRNSAYVDLLVHVALKNNWLVEFSDLICKSSSNFKSMG